ncbi:MAG: hypothetical protein U0V87_09980 [Acidobacteriota bacterium]
METTTAVLEGPTHAPVEPVEREFIVESIAEKHRRGATVLLSPLVTRDIDRACERLVMVGAGTVLLEGRINALMTTSGEIRKLTVAVRRHEQVESLRVAGYELSPISLKAVRVVFCVERRDALEQLLCELAGRIVGLAPGRHRPKDRYGRALDARA